MANISNPDLNEYRADIDGLRAIAVLAVVLFHAGVTGFGGGYVGVDVFFVISGYLITQILRRDINQTGRIDIVDFYERRVRRIVPALLVFFAFTLAAGYAVFMPDDLVELAKETLASLLFVSNVKFWRGADYWFSGVRPLLHTWSLSIEEQFYLFFPLLLAFLAKRGARTCRTTLLLLWALSLAVSIAGVNQAPSAAFFLLPSRIWELTTGAILALDFVPRFRSIREQNVAAAVGLLMVVVPCLTYTDRTPFPGLPALVPCIGTALLLQAGRETSNVVSIFLSQRLLVGIGLISYSLYLYHYPVFLIAKELAGNEDLSFYWALGAVIVSLLLAVVSWRFVERPFRNRGSVKSTALFAGAVLGSAVISVASISIIFASGLPQRFTLEQQSMLAAKEDIEPRFQECIKLPLTVLFSDPRCKIGKASAARDNFVVLGDSHAAAIASAVEPLAIRGGVRGTIIGFGSCPPLLGLSMAQLAKPARAECVERVENTIETVRRDASVSTVIIIAYWPAYDDVYGADAARLLSAALLRTVDALHGKRVLVLYDIPEAGNSLPRNLVVAQRFGQKQPMLELAQSTGILHAAPELRRRHVRLISLALPLCPERENCPALNAGSPILIDTNHLSRSAAIGPMANYLADQKLLMGDAEEAGSL